MPTGLRGRALALALLLLLLGILYLFVAAPLLGLYAERQSEIGLRRMLLPRLEAAGRALPTLRARLAVMRGSAGARQMTLAGATDAIAAANLESRIDALANSVGATVGSTESLPPETRGPYRRIGLRVMLSGPYETLVNLLAKLETAQPPLVVDDVQLHGAMLMPGRKGPAILNAGIDVYGFRASADAAKR